MTSRPDEITQLLIAWNQGDQRARDELAPLIYDELRRLARGLLRRERPGHTLQPTALVHEAFLRLVEQSQVNWQNRAHFYGAAAQLMRRLLVSHARRRNAAKRGVPITLSEDVAIHRTGADQTEEILAVDQILERLVMLEPRQARIVE